MPRIKLLPHAPLSLSLQFVTDGGGQLMVLGEGGHAVVYLARLRGIAVAVKVRRSTCPCRLLDRLALGCLG
jgi:predicted Ser/Thr protein kinase